MTYNDNTETKSEFVYQAMEQDLMRGVLAPGTKLKISKLQDRYQVSLSPLREAMNRLAAQGTITLHNQKGFFVSDISVEDMLDICATRIHIECEALTLSIKHGDTLWESKVVGASHQLDKTPPRDDNIYDWEELHENYHATIISACKSPRLIQFSYQLRRHLDKYHHITSTSLKAQSDIADHHIELTKCATSRNISEAVRMLKSHIEISRDTIHKALTG